MSYCQGKTKAKVFFKSNGFSDIVISKSPPVTVNCSGADYIDFSHSMTSPISQTFDYEVRGIENIGGSWNPGGKTPTVISCPTTNSNPVNSVYPEANGQPIRIEGNRVIGDFDSVYSDNSGTCSYRVYFNNVNFIISDTSGVIYQKTFTNCPKFDVSCDEECPPDHIRCEQPGYPGYCCLPCQPIAQRINNLAARIK